MDSPRGRAVLFVALVAKMNRSNECAGCLTRVDFDGVCQKCGIESALTDEELAETMDFLISMARALDEDEYCEPAGKHAS